MIDSREDQFLKISIEAAKEKDTELYETAATKYKNYTDLDKWKKKIFDSIKERISEHVHSEVFF